MRIGLPAGAALCLLVAGCDYWKNLLDAKAVAKADTLTVSVRDAWTREPLDADCRAAGIDFLETSGDSGRIEIYPAPTGRYELACSDKDSNYLEGKLRFDVEPGERKSVIVEMPRRGGARWYRENELRADVYLERGRSRVPESIELGAQPFDKAAGIFRYEWFIAKRPLIRTDTSILPIRMTRADNGLLEYGVKIFANFPSYPEYLVDSAWDTTRFALNDKPRVGVVIPDGLHEYQAGCRHPLTVRYVASDVDGSCDSLVFTSVGARSSLGQNFRAKVACTQDDLDTTVANFDLYDSVPAGDFSVARKEYLKAVAWDDNEDTAEAVLQFLTIGNRPPAIKDKIFRQTSDKVKFTGYDVEVQMLVEDRDSRIETVVLNWGDNTSRNLPVSDNPTGPETLWDTHAYQKPGTYQPYATITDVCGGTLKVNMAGKVEVKVNEKPTLKTVFHSFDSPSVLKLVVDVGDPDMELKADSLLVIVNWKDGTSPEPFPIKCCASVHGKELAHTYANAAQVPDSVHVRVLDAHSTDTSTYWLIPGL